jgi:uncharacterized membrane protein (DUF106 family)
MKPEETQARLPRVVVDLKIPMWGLMSAAAVLAAGLINMYITLIDVSSKMSEMQGTVKATNGETIKMAQEQALIKYRLEKLEAKEK